MPEYVSQRKLIATLPEIDEPIGPVEGSQWDTPDAIRARILSASDDYPLSARWIGQGAQAFYSLRTTILRNPDQTVIDIYRRINSSDFDGFDVSWSPEEFIFVAVDTRLSMGSEFDVALLEEIRAWLTDVPPDAIDTGLREELTDDLASWYLRKKRVHRDGFEQSVTTLKTLPDLDRSIDNADPIWRPFLDTPLPTISPDLRTLVYDYTPEPGCDPTCAAFFQRMSVAAWPPAPMSLAICLQQGGVGYVQTATGQMPFPAPPLLSEFFPWDEDTASTDRIFVYRTELGWASLHIHEGISIRLSLIEDAHSSAGSDRMPMGVRLDAWEDILGGFVIRRTTRRIEDLGVRLRLVFSDIPIEGFSWPVFYDTLVNDPLVRCFLIPAPERLAIQMPNPKIDSRASPIVPQQMALDWTAYACRLWNLDTGVGSTVSSRSNRPSLQAAVMIREEPVSSLTIVIGLTTPVPEDSTTGMVEFFRHLFVHVGTYRSTTGAWFDRTDRSVLRQGEKIFLDFLRKSYRISPETDLTKRLPTLFVTPFYKSLCQLPLQPRIMEEEDAKALALSCDEESCDTDHRLRFPPQEMHGVSPAWYVCPSTRFPYPGLKKNNMENALFPLVPCCFEKPQLANNREKLLKMSLGVDIVSTKRKDNIIQKHHIIRHQGQRGLPPTELQNFFVTHYPLHQVYRIGMNWTPFSFLECLHYVQVNGVSMPLAAWYPAHLVNLLQRHSGLVVGCMPFHTSEDIIYRIQTADRDFWVDPQLFLTFFEQIFHMRILVWAEDTEREREYRLLRSDRPIDPPPTHTVYILQHRGGRMDRLAGRPYPQCELFEWHPLTRPDTPSSPLFSMPVVLRRPMVPHPLQARLRHLRYQAVFPTGQIRAIRSARLTLWIEPPSYPSIDLEFWDPFTEPPPSIPTTALLREECEHLGIHLDPEVHRYSRAGSGESSRSRHLLFWHGIFIGSSLTVRFVTDDIPRHGIEEVVPNARIVPISEPPIWLASYCHPTAPERSPPALENAWSPTVLRRNSAILFMLRDVAVFRFSQWRQSPEVRALETIPFPEMIQEFLRTQSIVRSVHYQTPNVFPTLLPLSYGEAAALCSDPMGRLLLPSDSIRSRLFYYLQWKNLYEANTPAPRPTEVRAGVLSSANPWMTADPRNALWPLPTFKKLWSVGQDTSVPNARRGDPADPWATTLPHTPSSYVVYTVEMKNLDAFLRDECPPWRKDLPLTSMILNPPLADGGQIGHVLSPDTIEILANASHDRTCVLWTDKGWTVIPPRTPQASSNALLLVRNSTDPSTLIGVIVHPSFF